jgi:hypothetical protein
MVREELLATIEQAGRDLEMYATDKDDSKSLAACAAGIKQILGIFRLLELKGASLLAEELYLTTSTIVAGDNPTSFPKKLDQISSTFFVMAAYIEYVQRAHKRLPVLLIPQINELRKLRKEAVLPESHFFKVTFRDSPVIPPVEPIVVSEEDFKPLVARLRHMYQMGLLGVLRNEQTMPSLGLMRRAMIRLQRLGGSNKPLTLLWWLGNLVIVSVVKQNMELLESRKMLFSRLDRVIRQLQQSGSVAFKANPPKGLVKELLYLLMLSGVESDVIRKLRGIYAIPDLGYTDLELSEERQVLQGPSASTVTSLVKVLQDEINNTKKVLEIASQGAYKIDDIEALIETLGRIAEILSMVGLKGPSATLKSEIGRVKVWAENGGEMNETDLEEAAKTLLFVESATLSLEYSKSSKDRLAMANEVVQREIVAHSELAQAEKIVLKESEAGLSLSKRALNSYSESDYDSGHIRNIAKTLTGVRGGMVLLMHARAAEALSCCILFVDEVLMQPDLPPALKELLETFADAIISVEYYIDTALHGVRPDEGILKLAEDSMAALGFPTKYVAKK